ncbi:MAG: DUF3047 domain-containing protein [Candidatus Omnitrophota bacterium]|nr:MAG: DUF3047 domain-containing protein [Candidatus Omnitrophota bacterium]
MRYRKTKFSINQMRKVVISCLLLCVILFLSLYYAMSFDLPKWFPFNKENALDEWKEKVFKGKVLYAVEPLQEGGYLSAKSQSACSGLVYRMKFHPKKYPMISWKWKVIKFPEKTQDKPKKGGWLEKDDYAARVYVIFPSWIFTSTRCIEYVWDEEIPAETIMTSPYLGNIKLIIVESGRENIGQWVSEERNIYEDYKKVFGRSSGYVGAIALMTDTDNTLSTAEALYTDIKVGYKNE